MINPNAVESQDSFVRSGGSPPADHARFRDASKREADDLNDLMAHVLARIPSKPIEPEIPKTCGWWNRPSATFGDETISFKWYGFDDAWVGFIGGPRITIKKTPSPPYVPSLEMYTPMRQIVVKHSPFANDAHDLYKQLLSEPRANRPNTPIYVFQEHQFSHLAGRFVGGQRTSDVLTLDEAGELKRNPPEDKSEPFAREPKRFHIVLKRFDSHGNPITGSLSAGINATNGLPVGWFDTFPAGDTRPWHWNETFVPSVWIRIEDGKLREIHVRRNNEKCDSTYVSNYAYHGRQRGFVGEPRYKYVDPIFSNDFHPWWLQFHMKELESWLPYPSKIKQANECAWSVRDRKIARERRGGVQWPDVPGWTAKRHVPQNHDGKKYTGSALFFRIDDLKPEGHAARKELHLFASKVLRETESRSNSVYLGNLDPIDRCGRCGCSFFTRDDGGDLRCRDCNRYFGFEFDPEALLEDEDGTPLFSRSATNRVVEFDQETGQIYDPNGSAWRRVMTEHEFLEAIILSGQMSRMYLGLNLRKNAGSRMILVEGWLPEDVALLTGEPELTIKTRADRLYTAWREHRDAGKAVTVTAQDVLSHKLLREQELQRFDSWADSIVERRSPSMPQYVG